MVAFAGLFAAAIAALSVGGISAATAAVTPANGNDVILPGGEVYQLDADGLYHLIPDVATANAMKLDWNNLQALDTLPGDTGDGYPTVTTSVPVSTLVAQSHVTVTPANGNDVILPDGSEYQLGDDGLYHYIPDLATAQAMHLSWDDLQPADTLPGPEGAAGNACSAAGPRPGYSPVGAGPAVQDGPVRMLSAPKWRNW